MKMKNYISDRNW